MEQLKMKTPVSLLSSALLLAMTSSVFAASSVDLSVKGLITPSACTPSLPGDVDFGKIAAKDLNIDTSTALERKTPATERELRCGNAVCHPTHRQSSRLCG